MIDRGAPLGPGYVQGLGAVTIFQSYKAGHLIVLDRRDQWHTLRRDRVQFRKERTNGTKHEGRR